MKNIFLAIEERIGKVATVALFTVIGIVTIAGLISIDQLMNYFNLFME